MPRLLAALAAACCGTWAAAQPLQPPDQQPDPPAQTPDKSMAALAKFPPQLRLGVRVNLLERQFRVIPTVVLVPDTTAYLNAIRGWSTTTKGVVRYPILIDDGSWPARQRIIRFVRAFHPSAVVRYQGAPGDRNSAPDPTPTAIQDAAASTWGAPTSADLLKHFSAMGFPSPGVVVCSASDPAWTAGVALAAYHGQPMLWIDPPTSPDPAGYMTIQQADAFNAQIMKGLDTVGLPWNKLGDEIEAVTLCFTSPVKTYLGEDKRKFFALTDVVGRSGEADGRSRWAWAGQIMGDASRASYDAMCALFLSPERAWLFDGYDASAPWNEFDMTRAAEALKKIQVESIVDDGALGRGLPDLRRRAAGVRSAAASPGQEPAFGIDAGLIAFNTSGNPEFFDLKPGQARSVDVPILRTPAMVYFVHSFSASAPRLRWTVGGMWMERGAYAYLGSVDEPFLQAFIPTPVAMSRLAGGIPWGAAVRMDGGTTWKLAVFGDPLITLGPRPQRTPEIPLPLKDTKDLSAALPAQLKDRDFTGALWTLALTGRDRDAARLLGGVARDDAKALTAEAALAGISSAFAAGDFQALLAAARVIGPQMRDQKAVEAQGLAEVRDMVWQAVNPASGHLNSDEKDILLSFIRPETHERDRAEAGAK